MPEKPEVMCVAKSLAKKILNKKITGCEVYWDNIIANPSAHTFSKKIVGEHINDVTTKGKFLVIKLDKFCLLAHLRMEGKFVFREVGYVKEKHEHVFLTLDDDISFRFRDVRKFGKMYLLPIDKYLDMPPLNNVGPDFYDDLFNAEYLLKKIKNKSLPIKTVLLDQSIIAGLGNIYVNEVLFKSSIIPTRRAKDVTLDECKKIIDASKEVLSLAYELGGSTIRTFTSSEGVHGSMQDRLLVHEKKICPKCGGEIIKIKVGGRGTYYCPNDQK